jgi:tetratricopeptide (TPR) repeat protein
MEGLALRLVTQKDQVVEPDLIWKNLTESYAGHYRNLDNPKVHFNDNIHKLLQNYRSAYLQLAFHYSGAMRMGKVPPIPYESLADRVAHFDELTPGQKVEVILDKMESVVPETVIPIRNTELEIQLGLMYYNVVRNDELRKRLDDLRQQTDLSFMDQLRVGSVYLQYLKDDSTASIQFKHALEISPNADAYLKVGTIYYQYGPLSQAEWYFNQALSLDPQSGQAVGGLLRVYDDTENWAQAVRILENWTRSHPQDAAAQRELQKYRDKLAENNKTVNP